MSTQFESHDQPINDMHEAINPPQTTGNSEDKRALNPTELATQAQRAMEKFTDASDAVWRLFEEKLNDIPDFVPVIKPMLMQFVEQYKAGAALRGVDTETGEQLDTLEKRVGAMTKHVFKALMSQGEAAFGAIGLLGMGTPNVEQLKTAFEALKVFSQEQTERTAEEKFIDLIPQGLKGIAETMEGGTAGRALVEDVSRLFDILGKHNIGKETMVKLLQENEVWKKIKTKSPSSSIN